MICFNVLEAFGADYEDVLCRKLMAHLPELSLDTKHC